MLDYGPCPVCDRPMLVVDPQHELHTWTDGSDCHAHCCPTCRNDTPVTSPDRANTCAVY